MKDIFYLCIIYFFVSTHVNSLYNDDDDDKDDVRLLHSSYHLPSNVKPEQYIIKLNFISSKYNQIFRGETNITIDVVAPTNKIILHAKKLDIIHIKLILNNGSIIIPQVSSIDSKLDRLTVKFFKTITMGKYMLHFIYNGVINEDSRGIIRQYYSDNDDNNDFFIATNLGSIGAREVFPCWDEPALKANFTIIIEHDTPYNVISNMHEQKVEYNNEIKSNIQTITFANTPKMSTFSVAFVIGNLNNQTGDDGIVSVWAIGKNTHNTKYILTVVQEVLNRLNNYTNIAYTDMGLKNLDVLILPKAEHTSKSWGLIIIPEDSIDINNDDVSDLNIQGRMIEILISACAYQWFGNLVSIKWWSDLWFHDGIVGYLGYLISKEMIDSYNILEQMIINTNFELSLTVNGYGKARIWRMGNHQIQRFNLEDDIALHYKTINVFYMTSYIVGAENFKKSCQNYLHNGAFKTTRPRDFIILFPDVTRKNIVPFSVLFDNWITTPGMAMITVQRNYTSGTAIVSQSSYMINYIYYEKYNKNYWLPINYVIQDNIDFKNSTITHWLPPNQKSIEIHGFKNNSWAIFNSQWFGFYHVNYDSKNWRMIIDSLKSNNHGNIHVVNRIKLLIDAWKFVNIGKLDYGILMSLMQYLEHETSYLPWIAIDYRVIIHMKLKLAGTKYYAPFQKFLSSLPSKFIEKIDLNELMQFDKNTTQIKTMNAFLIVCQWMVPLCISKSSKFVSQWLENPKKYTISQRIQNYILCFGIQGGNQTIWKIMMQRWIDDENINILHALGYSLNRTNINELLLQTIKPTTNESKIELIFDAVRRGSILGEVMTVDFIIENWIFINPRYRVKLLQRTASLALQKSSSDKIHIFLKSNNDLEDTNKMKILFLLENRFRKFDSKISELDDFFQANNII